MDEVVCLHRQKKRSVDAFCPELVARATEPAEAPFLFRSSRAFNGNLNLLKRDIPTRNVKVVFGH